MPLNINEARPLLKNFELANLFNLLGWDKYRESTSVSVNGQIYILTGVAEKRGLPIFTCAPLSDGKLPDFATRSKIERELAKQHYEHLIIFHDAAKAVQLWQWVKREDGKVRAIRSLEYRRGMQGDLLLQKLDNLSIDLTEEVRITLTDVTRRVRGSFDVETVTRNFYNGFAALHKNFVTQIEGLLDSSDRDWYTSIMLNRLMFIYFIQKKGFLDGKTNYLSDKLAESKRLGADNYDKFYRSFLLHLFQDGLGNHVHPTGAIPPLGNVPYLNGGIFEPHQLELENTDIHIPDVAFERVFSFFNEWDWTLDTRPNRPGNEVNPDVLGFIFEKYINQKQMGAYYTKEDITGYIARSTIIPHLFEAARDQNAAAFKPDGEVWRLLKEDPDRYIYSAIQAGVDNPLPADIEAGVADVSRRTNWNKPAPQYNDTTKQGYGLPTEIWREVVARRQRYTELKAKLSAGEVIHINDLITLNLDIVQFAQDVVDNSLTSDASLLYSFWEALEKITVLDPTCGSGAFLFAALDLLEPLYEGCLRHMQMLVDEADAQNRKTSYTKLRAVLARVNRHSGTGMGEPTAETDRRRRYYVYKTIILNNLYGVDIMEEAVEIARLRLFLKLAAQVEPDMSAPNMGIEPLPDIDFNIKAGNTLVGFASLEEVRKAITGGVQGKMDLFDELGPIRERAKAVARSFDNFRQAQEGYAGEEGLDMKPIKAALSSGLVELRDELDRYQAKTYGVPATATKEYANWRKNHQPFHWCVEFYDIIENRGGFDVIIGNPPYVEYSRVKSQYQIKGYKTIESGNIFAMTFERSLLIGSNFISLIVPISAICTDRTTSLQDLLKSLQTRWYSAFDVFPSRVFEGAAQRVAIVIGTKGKYLSSNSGLYTSRYYRWYHEERPTLISEVSYADSSFFDKAGWTPRIEKSIAVNILKKISQRELIAVMLDKGSNPLYVHRIINNYIKAINFVPYFKKATGETTVSDDFKRVYVKEDFKLAFMALLNSSLFFWYWRCHGDGFHCGYRDIEKFPLDFYLMNPVLLKQLVSLAEKLGKDLDTHSEVRIRNQVKTGRVELQTFFVGASKPIIDEIDRVLAQHYGFTDEELDFIINYDIKYRLGVQDDDTE